MRKKDLEKSPFKNISNKEWKDFLKRLKEKEIELDKIDYSACDKQANIDGLYEYVKDMYGLELPEKMKSKKDFEIKDKKIKEDYEKNKRVEIEKMIINEDLLCEKIIRENKATDSIMLQHKDEIRKEVSDYNKFCEPISWCSLFSLMNIGRFNVLNLTSAGLGKSRSSLVLYERFFKDLSNISAISGHISPRKFFDLLKRNGIIIIDESYSLLSNSNIQHLLRSAIYDGRVVWYSTREENDEEIDFLGSIIFNSNQFDDTTYNNKALVDRTFCNKFDLNGEQVIEKMKSKYVPNKEIWELIKNRIIAIRNKRVTTKLTRTEKELVLEFTTRKIREMEDYKLFSFRILERITEIFYRTKLFFGILDKDLIDFSEKLASNYIITEFQQDVYDVLIDTSMSEKEKVEKYKQLTGRSRRSYYRDKKRLVNKGM